MNKRTVFTALLVLALATPAAAQDLTHKVELSWGLGLAFSQRALPTDYPMNNTISLSLRAGYVLTRTFELETEGSIAVRDGDQATTEAAMAAINGIYLIPLPSHPNLHPFLLGGVGIWDRRSNMIGVINLGAGLKASIDKRAAFRLEYRLQRYPDDSWPVSHGFRVGTSWFI